MKFRRKYGRASFRKRSFGLKRTSGFGKKKSMRRRTGRKMTSFKQRVVNISMPKWITNQNIVP